MTGDTSSRAAATTLSSSVVLHELPVRSDSRGRLTFAEYADHIPFIPQRFFLLDDVPAGCERGNHAHRECHQFIVCVRGGCRVSATDGVNTDDIELRQPTTGLYVPPMTWVVLVPAGREAAVLVMASHIFDEADYIRDWDAFRDAVRAR